VVDGAGTLLAPPELVLLRPIEFLFSFCTVLSLTFPEVRFSGLTSCGRLPELISLCFPLPDGSCDGADCKGAAFPSTTPSFFARPAGMEGNELATAILLSFSNRAAVSSNSFIPCSLSSEESLIDKLNFIGWHNGLGRAGE